MEESIDTGHFTHGLDCFLNNVVLFIYFFKNPPHHYIIKRRSKLAKHISRNKRNNYPKTPLLYEQIVAETFK